MSLFIASLNSGSTGNCYYLGNNNEAVLIDAGLSCKEVEKRMLALGLNLAKLKAIFITHEHTDHISGLSTLAKKLQLAVYITAPTYRGIGFVIDESQLRVFTAFEAVQVGGLSVTAFPKWHDACDPHSIIVTSGSVTAGVFTDIGKACKNVIHYFKQCHAVFLESNYDEEMLANGRYPYFLKKRITGGRGHLSNREALQLFLEHRPAFMTHVVLSHLSKENNNPSIATALFAEYAGAVTIVHAPRDRATAVYQIRATEIAGVTERIFNPLMEQTTVFPARRKKTPQPQLQLSLF